MVTLSIQNYCYLWSKFFLKCGLTNWITNKIIEMCKFNNLISLFLLQLCVYFSLFVGNDEMLQLIIFDNRKILVSISHI